MQGDKKSSTVFGGQSYSINDTNLSYVDLTLDTKFAGNSGTESRATPKEGRWQFQLNNNLKNVIGYAVLWVQIPFTYNVTDKSCNKFRISEGAGFTEIELDPGTYNAFNIGQNIEQKLTAAGFLGYTVVINQINGKFTLYNSTNSFTLNIDSNSQNYRLIELLGLFPKNYNANLNQTYSGSSTLGSTTDENGVVVPAVHYLTGNGVVDFGGDRIIKFYMDPLRQNEFSSAQDELGTQNAVAIIPVNATYGGVITYKDNHPQLVPTYVNSMDSLVVWLTSGDESLWVDNEGNEIGEIVLNGQTFQFSIRIFMQR